VRGQAPVVFTNCRDGHGVEAVVEHLLAFLRTRRRAGRDSDAGRGDGIGATAASGRGDGSGPSVLRGAKQACGVARIRQLESGTRSPNLPSQIHDASS
jgi:hypothetical protein